MRNLLKLSLAIALFFSVSMMTACAGAATEMLGDDTANPELNDGFGNGEDEAQDGDESNTTGQIR